MRKFEKLRVRLDGMHAALSPEQRQAVADVAVFNVTPNWFFVERLGLREDRAERAALVSGLDRLAGSTAPALSPRRGEAPRAQREAPGRRTRGSIVTDVSRRRGR
jgi:hypothetical protein